MEKSREKQKRHICGKEIDGMRRKELELPEVDYQAAYEAWIAERRKEELKLTEEAEGSYIAD